MLILVPFCSALCLMFWPWLQLLTPPVTVVSSSLSSMSSVTVTPSLTRFSVSLDQHGVVLPPPLTTERLWMCSWLSFCATAATSIFNASFSLCELCYGFSTGRFLFQSWASHHLYLIYVWCPFWCLLFTFRYLVGCSIHLWGLNH